MIDVLVNRLLLIFNFLSNLVFIMFDVELDVASILDFVLIEQVQEQRFFVFHVFVECLLDLFSVRQAVRRLTLLDQSCRSTKHGIVMLLSQIAHNSTDRLLFFLNQRHTLLSRI